MKKLIYLLFFLPCIHYGQISFIKTHPLHAWVDRLAAPYELSSGNFISSVYLIENSVHLNKIFLFDPCGELITSLLVSAPGEYMYITNFFELDSARVLATGYLNDSLGVQNLHLILDAFTLDVLKQKRTFETNAFMWATTIKENGLLWQVGRGNYGPIVSRLNPDLSRNLHIYRTYRDFESPDYNTFNLLAYRDGILFTEDVYRDDQYQYYSIIRCLDRKLREQYHLVDKTDTSYFNFVTMMGQFDNDTILVGGKWQHRMTKAGKYYVRKYHRDNLISSREVAYNDAFFSNNRCIRTGNALQCINWSHHIKRYNTDGELIFKDSVQHAKLDGGDLVTHIITRDSGLFAIAFDYDLINGVDIEVIKVIRTTPDYQILDQPDPSCIVPVDQPLAVQPILVFPNPATNRIHLQSEHPILQVKVFSLTGALLAHHTVHNLDFEIETHSGSGYVILHMLTEQGWSVQRVLVIN